MKVKSTADTRSQDQDGVVYPIHVERKLTFWMEQAKDGWKIDGWRGQMYPNQRVAEQ